MSIINEPLISIVIENYRTKSELKQSLLSCIKQSYCNLEIILCNRNRINKTWNKYLNELSKLDNRIKLINIQDDNFVTYKQKQIDYINGEYVVFLNGNDYLDFDFIRHDYFFLLMHKATVVVNKFNYLINHKYYFNKQYICIKHKYEYKDMNDFFFDSQLPNMTKNALWNKFFQTSCLKDGLKELNNTFNQLPNDMFSSWLIVYLALKKANKVIVDFQYIGIFHHEYNDFYIQKNKKTEVMKNFIYINTFVFRNYIFSQNKQTKINFYWTIIRTIAYLNYINSWNINDWSLDEIKKIFNFYKTTNEQIIEDIKNINKDTIIPIPIRFNKIDSKIKKAVLIADKVSFSLTSGVYVVPFLKEDDLDTEIDFAALNYEVLDILLYTLYINKQASIAYDPNFQITKRLIEDLNKLIERLHLNVNNVKYFVVYNSIISEFNILIDQWRITQYSIFDIWNTSKINCFLAKYLRFKEKELDIIKRLFFLSLIVTNNNFLFNKHSFTNYSFTMFFCFFVLVVIKTNITSDIKNNIGRFFFRLFQEKITLTRNPVWNLELNVAINNTNYLLEIIKKHFPDLLNQDLSKQVYEAIFNKLSHFAEFDAYLPNQFILDNEKVMVLDSWRENYKTAHRFNNIEKYLRNKQKLIALYLYKNKRN